MLYPDRHALAKCTLAIALIVAGVCWAAHVIESSGTVSDAGMSSLSGFFGPSPRAGGEKARHFITEVNSER